VRIFTVPFRTYISNTKGLWKIKKVCLQHDEYNRRDANYFKVKSHIRVLTASINHALALSFRRNPFQGPQNSYVAHISLIKGIPFYGYHVGYRRFLKVYLRNPNHMTRFADLLSQGAILARFLQPYESHLQYLLQWMCDYNLYGCGFVDCEKVKFRHPIPTTEESADVPNSWSEDSIPPSSLLDPTEFPRQSHCAIEVDVRVEDILNRQQVKAREIHRDFSERFFNPEEGYKFVPSMAGLWRDEAVRRKKRMGLESTNTTPFPPEALVTMSADPRLCKGNWIHEEEHFKILAEIVENEKTSVSESRADFDSFLTTDPQLTKIQTAFESIGELYPEVLANSLSSEGTKEEQSASVTNDEIVVDEDSIYQITGSEDKGVEFQDEGNIHSLEKQSEDVVHRSASPIQSSNTKSASFKESKVYQSIAGKSNYRSRNSSDDRMNEMRGSPKKRKLNHQTEISSENSQSSKSSYQSESLERKASREEIRGFLVKPSSNGVNKGRIPEPNNESNRKKGPNQHSSLQRSSSKAGTQNSITSSFSVTKTAATQSSPEKASEHEALTLNDQDTQSESSLLQRIRQYPGYQKVMRDIISQPIKQPKPVPEQVKIWASRMSKLSKSTPSRRQYLLGSLPPNPKDIMTTLVKQGRSSVLQQEAYYSDEVDVPEQPQEYFSREFKLQSLTLPFLSEFDRKALSPASLGENQPVVLDNTKQEIEYKKRRDACTYRVWQLATPPPRPKFVKRWVSQMKISNQRKDADRLKLVRHKPRITQIEGPTMLKEGGPGQSFKSKTSVVHQTQYMSLMSLEVHVDTRRDLAPDPAVDPIKCIFWSIRLDSDDRESPSFSNGIMILTSELVKEGSFGSWTGATVYYEEDELELLNRFIDIVHELDPDILVGYEVHNGSWGYLIERARIKFEFDLCMELSRVISHSNSRSGREVDRWGFTHTSAIRVTGRHMINVWRAVRGELNLLQYTMENAVFKVLRKRIPHYSFKQLTDWYQSNNSRNWTKVLNYFLSRVQLNILILEGIDVVARTSEQARLLGVDWFSVILRGSQFKVESLMFRIAKPENYILPSPSRKQVGQQNALECLPLVMEPQSNFYPSPVLVLDFQSLYPSIMIAYNYCYSTCLGRIVNWRGQNKMGFTNVERETGILGLLQKHLNIAPNGMMYVRPEMRRSLLAKMLTEILETRVMVKSGMKQDRDDNVLQRLLNNRQLALKLIANVTYGYASASFSGRMPCAEIADSIVQSARETLEKAVAMIHSVKKWDAEVVYGDTDSIFVYLKNRSREEAFKIGKEIADTVTKANPRPVKLKFEKVYHPCVLLAKKRYVGWKYESPDQTVPEFDAKGIETVRRDGTPVEQKIEEKALKILFRTHDLSQVKRYFQEQCFKIMAGNVSIQDFLFAREVKLGNYSENGLPPAGAMIATKRMHHDPRKEPQYGERVPYLVIAGAPGARLIDRCVDPDVLLNDDQVELDAEYYIGKNIIPPLERIFNLVGANVRAWYDEIPKVQRLRAIKNFAPMLTNAVESGELSDQLKKTLETYLKDKICFICRESMTVPLTDEMEPNESNTHDTDEGNETEDCEVVNEVASLDKIGYNPIPICDECNENAPASLFSLQTQLQALERRLSKANAICRTCSGVAFADEVTCDSRDCPVFYTRLRHQSKFNTLREKARIMIEGSSDDLSGIYGGYEV
jgi:DNA polymerase zeta